MHEIRRLPVTFIVELMLRDYVQGALGSCPQHFPLRKVGRDCSEDLLCLRPETDRQRLTEREGRQDRGARRSTGWGGGALNTWEKVQKAPFCYSDVFWGSRGLPVWDTLGRNDLDPTRRQRSACLCVHTEVAASPFSENSRICHFQQGLGRHQDCLCVWSPMSNFLSSCFPNA